MQPISANATSPTHGYVLYVVIMHTEGITYRYKLSPDFFYPAE